MAGIMERISVLLPQGDSERFSSYCKEHGHKKSTLIARLVREHLDREGYNGARSAGALKDNSRRQGKSR